jgi:trypsin-like peptidase
MRWDPNILMIAVALTGTSSQAIAKPDRSTAEQVAKSVVSITASQCDGQSSRTGTGFLYQNSNRVVTAHHVVAGCRSISLWFERSPGQPTLQAQILRVLVKNDLALLSINSSIDAPFLRRADSVDFNETLKAIGYPINQPTLGDQDVDFSIGNDQLRLMLPTENLRELAGLPLDLNARIYRFKSALYPGMSGGPIFDTNGDVVAIVAGGLKSGAVAASWGWPAKLLTDLQTSRDALDTFVDVPRTFYTYSRRGASTERRRCGNIDFARVARRSFSAMSGTADNPDRLAFTVNMSGRPRAEIDAFEFDIWSNLESGATVAVPAGTDLHPENGLCIANSTTGPFYQLIWGTPIDQSQQITAAIEFEQRFMAPRAMPNFGYEPDTVLTLPQGQLRNDGFLVNRKAFTINRSPFAQVIDGMHQFETIMTRSGAFVGVATVNFDLKRCLTPVGQFLSCPMDSNYLAEWTRFVLGTQLATFPVY